MRRSGATLRNDQELRNVIELRPFSTFNTFSSLSYRPQAKDAGASAVLAGAPAVDGAEQRLLISWSYVVLELIST